VVDLLREIVPTLARLAVPFNPVSAPYADFYLNILRSAAPGFGVKVIPQSVADMGALEAFVAAHALEPNTAIIPMPSAFSRGHTAQLAAMTMRLPALYPVRSFAVAGGLVSYGNDVSDNFRKAANLRGQDIEGREAERASGPVSNQVQSCDQSQDSQIVRPHGAFDIAGVRRRGDRVSNRRMLCNLFPSPISLVLNPCCN
jgi:hypothetical protein